jgi:hypothetical protein
MPISISIPIPSLYPYLKTQPYCMKADMSHTHNIRKKDLLAALGHLIGLTGLDRLIVLVNAEAGESVQRVCFEDLVGLWEEELSSVTTVVEPVQATRLRTHSESEDRLGLDSLIAAGLVNSNNELLAQALQDVSGIFVEEGAISIPQTASPLRTPPKSPTNSRSPSRSPDLLCGISPKSRSKSQEAPDTETLSFLEDQYEKREIESAAASSSPHRGFPQNL